jgi:O-antigen/teichoic acid export membrane protein
VIGQVLLLLGMVQLARVVGPAAFGMWSYSQAWFFYLLRAGEFGLEVTGIRAIARDKSGLRQRVAWVLTLRLFMAIVLFGVVALLAVSGVIPSGSSTLVVLFSLGVFPVAVSLEWIYEAVQKTRNAGLARVLKGSLFFLFVILGVRGSGDLMSAALYYVLSLCVPSVVLLVVVKREFGLGSMGISWSKAKELLREAWPIAVATLCSQYSLFFSTIFLGYVASESEVGFFTAAHRLVIFVWAYGIVASNRVLLPTLASYFAEAEDKYVEFLRSATRILAIVALPIGVIGSVVAPGFIGLLYGPQYSSSSGVFQVLVWALVVAVARSGLEIGLIASHRQNLYLRGMALNAALHTVLAPIGYAMNGIVGVGAAMLVAESCYTLYIVFVSRSARILQLVAVLWRIPVAAGLTLGALLVLPMSLLISIPAGVLLYGGTLVLLGELSPADRLILRQLVGL